MTTLRAKVLETGGCYCCNDTDVRHVRDRLGFLHIACSKCKLLRIHPDHLIPNKDAYTNEYFNGTMHKQTGGKIGYAESYSDLGTSHRTSQYKVYTDEVARLIRRLQLARPRVLDFGCAYGLFLKLLKEQLGQLEVHGVEVDPEICKRASANLGGAPIYHVNFRQNSHAVPRNYFDVITLIDVIEHLDDPEAYLEMLAECIKPGGYILLSTPNIESFNAKIYKDSWILHTPPLHTYYFGRRSLSILLERTGWKVIKFYTEQTIFHNERHGMETWRGKAFRLLFQNRSCDLITNKIMHLGSIMTLIAQRT